MADKFEQFSPLMDDAQLTMELVKAYVSNHPLANQLFIEVQGELLQLTLNYTEQCAAIVKRAVNRMNKDRLQ